MSTAQHLLILAIFVTAGLQAWRDAAIAASILATSYIGRRLFPLIGEIAAFYRGQRSYLEFEQLRKRQEPLGYPMLFFLGTCAAVIITGLRTSLPCHGSLGQWLARSGLVGGGGILALVAVG